MLRIANLKIALDAPKDAPLTQALKKLNAPRAAVLE